MNITALILDDEQQSREVLQELLKQFCPDVTVIGSTGKIEEALQLMRSAQPDLLFLDINLGDQTGFDFLNMLHQYNCSIIFITAYEHYALKAFEYAAINYLLKPINYKQLIESVCRIQQKKNVLSNELSRHFSTALQQSVPALTTIVLSDMNKTDFVPLEKIIYLKSNGPYTVFYLDDNSQYTKSKTLKFYEDTLQCHKQFIRVHKSYMINKLHVKSYRKATSELECTGNIIIPTTLSYKTLLDRLLS